VVSRAKTSRGPPAPHFGVESGSANLRDSDPDYLERANLYRRRILDAQPQGAGGIGSRWFVGARSGFLAGYQEGQVRVSRTVEDAAADGIDGVIVTLVLTGRLRVMADGRDETFEAGELFMEDTLHAREAVNSFGASGSVFIPRDRFVAAVATPTERLTLTRLSRTPLGPAVIQQIGLLHQSLGVLAPDDFELLLEGVTEAALGMLRKLAAEEPGAADPVLTAAKALIEARHQDVQFTPAGMARSLGCSRAVLYRSFANAGLTVAGYVRDVRFRRFLELVRTDAETPISRLAYDSGFAMAPSDFAKLFRRAYGVTPSEARRRLSP